MLKICDYIILNKYKMVTKVKAPLPTPHSTNIIRERSLLEIKYNLSRDREREREREMSEVSRCAVATMTSYPADLGVF